MLLVYYASWCGFCINLAPVLLTVARFFKDNKHVTIARWVQSDLIQQYTITSKLTSIHVTCYRIEELRHLATLDTRGREGFGAREKRGGGLGRTILRPTWETDWSVLLFRIDGDQNDLPWQHTVAAYPTMILFPAKRYVDTVHYGQIQGVQGMCTRPRSNYVPLF